MCEPLLTVTDLFKQAINHSLNQSNNQSMITQLISQFQEQSI